MNILRKYYWAIIPVVAWLIVRFVFGFNGLYGQDAYAYLLHAREWKAFFLRSETPGSFFWPPNYSIVSALLALIINTEFYSLQLTSVLSIVGLAGILNAWIKEAYNQVDESVRIGFITLTFLLSPYMLRLGMQSMSDMLAMFLLTASFFQLWKLTKNDLLRDLLLWSVFSALAITTRYPAVIVLLPSIGFVGFRLLSKGQLSRLVIGLLVAGVPLSMAAWWKLESGGMQTVLDIDLIQNWHFSNLFKSEFHTSDTNSKFLLPNLVFNLNPFIHPGTVFFGAILLLPSVASFKKGSFNLLLIGSILLYACLLSGVPFQNTRVATFTYPLIVIFLFSGFVKLCSWLRAKNIPLKLVLIFSLVIQLGLCARALQPSISYNHFEQELATWIQQNCATKTVYTSSYSQLFDVYETSNSVVQIFDSELNEFEDGSVFIFNKTWANFKLKGTTPLRNWEKAQSLMQITELKCWKNGWCVYSLESK